MIRLLHQLVVNYSFMGYQGASSPHDVVYMNELGTYTFESDVTPLAAFPDLASALKEYDGLEQLLQWGVGRSKSAHLIMDEDDVLELLVRFFRGIYPNITRSTLEHLLRLTIAQQCFVETNHTRNHTNRTREKCLHLRFPNRGKLMELYSKTQDQAPLSETIKKNLSSEYLLAHAVACDFAEEDPYVAILANQIDSVLWDLMTGALISFKKNLFQAVFRWEQILGISVDPFTEDVEQKLRESGWPMLTLNEEEIYSLERTPENAKAIIKVLLNAILKSAPMEEEKSDFRVKLWEMYDQATSDGLQREQILNVIRHDLQSDWSVLFGRPGTRQGQNALLLSQLNVTQPKYIQDLRLDQS